MATIMTKPGKHGTLYRYAIEYTDPIEPAFGTMTWHTWAYDSDHALELFYADDGSDTEFRAIRWARLTDAQANRQSWHKA